MHLLLFLLEFCRQYSAIQKVIVGTTVAKQTYSLCRYTFSFHQHNAALQDIGCAQECKVDLEKKTEGREPGGVLLNYYTFTLGTRVH